MKIPTLAEVENRKKLYEGKRIELFNMPSDPHPVEPSSRGLCEMVDGIGQLVMKWDSGRTLSLIPGVDRFRVVDEILDQMMPHYDEAPLTDCPHCGKEYNTQDMDSEAAGYTVVVEEIPGIPAIYRHECGGLVRFIPVIE